jgi:cytochrome o ubiquinol oxidase subunit 3
MLFATLFMTWAVLHGNTFGGPPSEQLFDLKTAFIQTMVLLGSSVSCGMALLSSLKNNKNHVLIWLMVTFVLGATFLFMESQEFSGLVASGNSWTRSGFLSSFFTLVGTHGLHISVGLLWMSVMMAEVFFAGITVDTFRRLIIFGMFWHFLDLVWIFIFTFVYLMGVL